MTEREREKGEKKKSKSNKAASFGLKKKKRG